MCQATAFYRATSMQGGLSNQRNVRLSVRPSVCLSVKRANCDKTKETSAKNFTPYKRTVHLVFLAGRLVGEGRPLLP